MSILNSDIVRCSCTFGNGNEPDINEHIYGGWISFDTTINIIRGEKAELSVNANYYKLKMYA